ncbi:hypothetical protein [Aeromicrobium sp.]|uniref:hypothetical protein n=1 Tax=Aeromicrobium sp. TaxID=1871063 RepID=UPI0025B9334B|nr:hypothetical protein [Aeromicrobium sp.]MCK5892258.1 hypothetical protein [Aeromicrobium sp.]
MTFRRLLVLPLLLLAALLVGCGSDDSDSDNSSTSSDSDSQSDAADDEDAKQEDRDDAVGTDDFSFIAPDGWEDISDDPTVGRAEIAYRDEDAVGSFAANVNVIRTPGPKMSVSDLEEAGIAELEAGGFQDVRADDPYKVDGVRSAVVSSTATQQGITYQTRQYYAQYDGAYYIITFSFSPDEDEDEIIDVSESVIDSWRWES